MNKNRKLFIIPLLSLTLMTGCGAKEEDIKVDLSNNTSEIMNISSNNVEEFVSKLGDNNHEEIKIYLDNAYSVVNKMNSTLMNYSSDRIESAITGNDSFLDEELNMMKENNILIRYNYLKKCYEAVIDYEYLYNQVKDTNLEDSSTFIDYLIIKANQTNTKTFSKVVFPNRDFVDSSDYEIINSYVYDEDASPSDMSYFLNTYIKDVDYDMNKFFEFNETEADKVIVDGENEFIDQIKHLFMLDGTNLMGVYGNLIEDDLFMIDYFAELESDVFDYMYGFNHHIFRLNAETFDEFMFSDNGFKLNPSSTYEEIDDIKENLYKALTEVKNQLDRDPDSKERLIEEHYALLEMQNNFEWDFSEDFEWDFDGDFEWDL